MRAVYFALGNVLFAVGLGGLFLLTFGPRDAIQVELSRLLSPQAHAAQPVEEAAPVQPESPPSPDFVPITRVDLPAVGLSSEVVPSRLIRIPGAQTWEVPAHRVGHAQGTAGAGMAGNAVLLGHVSSINAGNVFKDLDRVQVGQDVLLAGETQQYRYRVTEIRTVPRSDVSVLEPTDDATLSLITCTGTWLRGLNDFSHRLVVRASLVA